jgi:hypothetical protein
MKTSVMRYIEEIESAFHRRAFGEERARVNQMPAVERGPYLRRVRKRAARTTRIETRLVPTTKHTKAA